MGILFLTTSVAFAAEPGRKDLPLGHTDFLPTPEHPVGFRGNGTGHFPGATPPLTWDVAKGTGIKWHTALPGVSASSVIVVGKKVFAVGSPHHVYCLNADTGAIMWQQDVDPVSCLAPDEAVKLRQELATLVAETANNKESLATRPTRGAIAALLAKGVVSNDFKYDAFFTLSAPTPASDGQRVYVQFPAGVLAAYDLDGKRLWMIPAVPGGWSMGNASPITYQNKVIAVTGSRGSPTLMCVEAATGKTLWTVKTAGVAHAGAGTPGIILAPDGPKVVCPVYSMYDLETGKEWFNHEFYNDYGSSPVVDGSRAYFIHGDGGKGATKRQLAIIDCSAKGPPAIASYPRTGGQGCGRSALLFDGKILIPEGGGRLPEIMDVTTGKSLVEVTKGKSFPATIAKTDLTGSPSPTWSGGHIYYSLHDGQVLVLDSTTSLKILATNQVAPMNGSPFFHGSRIYFRTFDAVWCIGSEKGGIPEP